MSDNFFAGGRSGAGDVGVLMESEHESNVWKMVQQTCDAATFLRLIEEALDCFKRSPGLDHVVRLQASDIGSSTVQVLRDVLRRRGLNAGASVDASDYVELRSRLKAHLGYQLQWHLVKMGIASDEMKEDHLGRDLGL